MLEYLSFSIYLLVVVFLLLPVVLVFGRLFSPISRVPGPLVTKITLLPLIYHDYMCNRTWWTISLHRTYGPVVRLSPTEVSFSSPAAVRDIYTGSTTRKTDSAVSGGTFAKGPLYDVFQHFGARNAISAVAAEDHGWRRRIVGACYTQHAVNGGEAKTGHIWRSVGNYLEYLRREGNERSDGATAFDVHTANLYYAGDVASCFVFGRGTHALEGDRKSRNVAEGVVEKEEAVQTYTKMQYPFFYAVVELLRSCGLWAVRVLSRREPCKPDWFGGAEFRDWGFKEYMSVKQSVKDGTPGFQGDPTAARFAAKVLAGERWNGTEVPIGKDKGLRLMLTDGTLGARMDKFLRDEGAAAVSLVRGFSSLVQSMWIEPCADEYTHRTGILLAWIRVVHIESPC